MIILKQLKVEHFRLLREIDLSFPQRGSILISGTSEAGKSTLLESIYFALYGEALVLSRGTRKAVSLDELVPYGEQRAVVTLTLAIGATEMTIRREIERKRGQHVVLRVQKLGMPAEKPVTNLKAANQRIIAEVGRIDGKTLRDSYLVEQKGLDRLEQLSGREREAALHILLGLEKLARLAEQFSLTSDDEHRMEEAMQRLRLAEIQQRIPQLSVRLGELEAALDAIVVLEDLAAIDQQEADISEQQSALEQVDARRLELKHRQHRITQLKKAGTVLDEIITTYDVIAETQRELPELEHHITELDRREREELPGLEQRVRELSDLTRSFGTLERMASDLLNAVSTIKELEQSIKQQEHLEESLGDLDRQIAQARQLMEETRQTQHELEEQGRSAHPQLEARLKRLEALSAKLIALKEAQEQYARRAEQRQKAEENAERLARLRQELEANEQELALVEKEAQQVQEDTDALEKRWRQLSIRRQLQEWQRLKGLSLGLTEAQQHVEVADAQRQQLNSVLLSSRRSATTQFGIFIACLALAVLCGGGALVEAVRQSFVFATIAGMLALVLGAIGGVNLQSYGKSRDQERALDRQLQDANNRVSVMVAAREAAVRMGGSQDELARIEHEISSLGGSLPRSVEESQALIQQLPAQEESLADTQQKVTERRGAVQAARSQVNVTMEAVAVLRKEKAHLQEQRQQAGWEDFETRLRADAAAVALIQQEIVAAAGQEGLPIPTFAIPSIELSPAVSSSSPSGALPEADLQAKLEEAIKATRYEMAALDGRMEVIPDIAARVKQHQDTLDTLLARKQSLIERSERFDASVPMLQIERARQQQIALREALRALQDSLRQRVLPLGVNFGQTAISAAEATSRKQLNALLVALSQRDTFQQRYTAGTAMLQESQELLSERYRQLAKYSNTLGSWIMPLNPFADALKALRQRCDREMEEANEQAIQHELERLTAQEDASRVKIELCQLEIEEARERIAALLVTRNRPPAKGYTRDQLAAVWPLISEYATTDRARLEDDVADTGIELRDLEQQDLSISEKLGTGRITLDLEQARQRMEQQERNYITKERAGLLVAATFDRLMRKMLPRIEYYMQQLLPLLTNGRYHEARLSTEQEESISSGGPLQVSLWEPAANAYIPLPSLSGSTADQVSLALRLAFAIAALPRELNAAPGFLLLDEPLSLASRDRMQSLVDVVTGETLGQHFEQIIFVSHGTTFDASAFNYHLTIDNGMLVESNLPANTEKETEKIAIVPVESETLVLETAIVANP